MSEHADPFRYCVHCAADCYADEPEHAADCPSSTGIYPFTEKDMECPYCKRELGEEHRMVCGECEQPFQVGDHYTHRWLDEETPAGSPPRAAQGMADAPIGEVICLGCAAKEELCPSE